MRKRHNNFYMFLPFLIFSILIFVFFPKIKTKLFSSPEDFLPFYTQDFFYFEDSKNLETFDFLKGKIKKYEIPEVFKDIGYARVKGEDVLFFKNKKDLDDEDVKLRTNFSIENEENKIKKLEDLPFLFYSDSQSALAEIELVGRKKEKSIKENASFRSARENVFRNQNIYYLNFPKSFKYKNIFQSFVFSMEGNEVTFFLLANDLDYLPNPVLSSDFKIDKGALFSLSLKNPKEKLDTFLQNLKEKNQVEYIKLQNQIRKIFTYIFGNSWGKFLSSDISFSLYPDKGFLEIKNIDKNTCESIFNADLFLNKKIEQDKIVFEDSNVARENGFLVLSNNRFKEIVLERKGGNCILRFAKDFDENFKDYEKKQSFINGYFSYQNFKEFLFSPLSRVNQNFLFFVPKKNFEFSLFFNGKGISGNLNFLN